MAAGHAGDHEADPLERRWRGKVVVLAALFATGLAFWLSTRRDDPNALPGVALDSPFLLDLERAAIVGAVVAGAAIFSVRGWSGYFPSKLSTTGAEYAERSTTDTVIGSGDETTAAIADIERRQVVIVRRISNRLAALEDRLGER